MLAGSGAWAAVGLRCGSHGSLVQGSWQGPGCKARSLCWCSCLWIYLCLLASPHILLLIKQLLEGDEKRAFFCCPLERGEKIPLGWGGNCKYLLMPPLLSSSLLQSSWILWLPGVEEALACPACSGEGSSLVPSGYLGVTCQDWQQTKLPEAAV